MSRCASIASSLLTLCLLALPAASQEVASNGYTGVCASISGNARSDESVWVDCQLTDGMNEISAGLISRNDGVDSSLWRLTDGVRLAFATAEITAQDALLKFDADELVMGEITGEPVVISDFVKERNAAVRGTAPSVSYDSRSGTVRLTGQATLAVGDNQVRGCDLIYNFNDKSYSAGASDACAGVTLQLAPPEDSAAVGGQTESP
jgi:lipopolysaccharide transport protein LptA